MSFPNVTKRVFVCDVCKSSVEQEDVAKNNINCFSVFKDKKRIYLCEECFDKEYFGITKKNEKGN
jgi:hypothetical protein